ncbi:hypothetical protein, variant [Aphanomyces astaci]|uniref:MalT-like TPR region domain-containing protein n=1 Tax=Aphanomyces astaci TaxID=112090 RepID=W4G9G5_APHAT|nr:hypothetical protein, variant [Aphanomyces astaci]ETV75931.1 hypothetical protein, variant [Aphanomyces astaci]|eukprot:XP_009834572.1 hypothetical protein, variant [Aphanomyces astaci]
MPPKPRGVTLEYIRQFIDDVGGRSKLQGLSTSDVWTQFVAPTLSNPSRGNDDANESSTATSFRAAEWCVYHGWNDLFLAVVDTLESWRSSLDTPRSFWLRVFNQPLHLLPPASADTVSSYISQIVPVVPNMLVLWPQEDPSTLLSCEWSAAALAVAATNSIHVDVTALVVPRKEILDDTALLSRTPLLDAYATSTAAITGLPFDAVSSASSPLTAAARAFLLRSLHAAIDREIQTLPTSLDQAHASYAFGLVLHKSADFIELAKTYYERATSSFPPTSREYFSACRQLALAQDAITTLLLRNDDLQNAHTSCATSKLQSILESQRLIFGDQDMDTIDTMVALGYVYASHSQPSLAWHVLDKAMHLRLECLHQQHQPYPNHHLSTLHVMELLASQSFALRRYKHAAAIYSTCLLHYDNDQHHHEDVIARLTCANNLAAVFMCQGQYNKARPLLTECLEQDILTFGLDDDRTLMSMANVAEVHRCLGEYMHAEWLVLSMWDRAKELYGDSSDLAILGTPPSSTPTYCSSYYSYYQYYYPYY